MTVLSWTAGKDGIAHASRPGHARTLCGQKAQDPRWAWPELSRCADCQAIDTWPAIRRVVSEPQRHQDTNATAAPTTPPAGGGSAP